MRRRRSECVRMRKNVMEYRMQECRRMHMRHCRPQKTRFSILFSIFYFCFALAAHAPASLVAPLRTSSTPVLLGSSATSHRAVLAISAKHQHRRTARVASVPFISCRFDALLDVEGPVQGAPSPTGRARSAIAARDGSAACVTSAVLRATRRRPATEGRGALPTQKAETAHEPAPARLQ